MSSAVSLEYLQSLYGQPNGIVVTDVNNKILVSQLPAGSIETFKGIFATSAVLNTTYPTGSIGDYAYVTATNSYWYWNSALTVPAWVNEQITATAYLALTTAQKGAIPYNIIP